MPAFGKTFITSTLLAGVMFTVGCSAQPEPTPVETTPVLEEIEVKVEASPANPTHYKVDGELGVEPKVQISEESGNVTELYTATVIPGTGEQTVKEGDTVTVHYIGLGGVSRRIFYSSWAVNQPATFSLNQVIPGWTEGLVGMRVGERRLLVIPGEKAYGEITPTAEIGSNETLVFVVDLISIP